MRVITLERAIADGISSNELIAVARWHEERATLIQRSLSSSSKKRKPIGTTFDIRRHESLAAEIRSVALVLSLEMKKAA